MSFKSPLQRDHNVKQKAESILKNNKVTELVNTDDVQIYRCRDKSDSVVYGFDIILAPNCITISGDIGRILYGEGKGLDFLAQYGCSDYGFEKLDSAYREKNETNDYLVADHFYKIIYEHLQIGFFEGEEFSEELKEPSKLSTSEELEVALDALTKLVVDAEKGKFLQGLWRSNDLNCFSIILRRLQEHCFEPSEDELMQIIEDSEISSLNIDSEWWEYDVTVPVWKNLWVTACAQWAATKWLEQSKSKAA